MGFCYRRDLRSTGRKPYPWWNCFYQCDDRGGDMLLCSGSNCKRLRRKLIKFYCNRKTELLCSGAIRRYQVRGKRPFVPSIFYCIKQLPYTVYYSIWKLSVTVKSLNVYSRFCFIIVSVRLFISMLFKVIGFSHFIKVITF